MEKVIVILAFIFAFSAVFLLVSLDESNVWSSFERRSLQLASVVGILLACYLGGQA